MLLGETVTMRECDDHFARRDVLDGRAQRFHETLALEAAADACLEIGISNLVCQ
jgi:hypothetical protein